MLTKVIVIVGLSAAAVFGVFLFGKFMDKGNAGNAADAEKEDKKRKD